MQPIITISGVSKTYASGFQALKGVDLDIRRGEIFGLLGPNGAGKTTLINIICGIVKPSSGQVKVAQGAGQQTYDLSSACLPEESELAGTLDVKLPLTTGEAPALMGPLPGGDSAGPQLQSDSCDSGTCQEGICTGDACVSGSGTFCLDAKGGISQACCSDNTAMPCFTAGAPARSPARAPRAPSARAPSSPPPSASPAPTRR